MAFTSELKNCLRANQLAVGSWLSLGHAGICEIMCNAGFRWVAGDLEHTTTSLEQAEAIIADGVPPDAEHILPDTVRFQTYCLTALETPSIGCQTMLLLSVICREWDVFHKTTPSTAAKRTFNEEEVPRNTLLQEMRINGPKRLLSRAAE